MTLQRPIHADPGKVPGSAIFGSYPDQPQLGGLDSLPASAMAVTLTEARRRLRAAHPIIDTELAWRRLQRPRDRADRTRIAASRWQASDDGRREARAETPSDGHLVKIVLRTTDLRLVIDRATIHDGVAMPGMVHVTEPGASARCLYRGPHDTLHLHVPTALIDECLEDARGGSAAAGRRMVHDPSIERLGRRLLSAGEESEPLGALYADCLGIAIVGEIFGGGRDQRGPGAGLAQWRLKRAIEYIEARLGGPVRLADMAAAAGLTRMHFAAQFKASTGLRPHEYLLRRRIERAQEMLLVAGPSLVDVALSVGFRTQSRFTTTFARLVGRTPHAWRMGQSAGFHPAPARC
jgi:AraC-like DNA-binding protein